MNACEISFKQAISGPDKQEWENAICSEIRSLILNNTFDFVDRPTNGEVIKCRTVLRNKYGADGHLRRRKARIVAKGFTQRPGVDFFETFAPVARLSSLRLLVALAAKFNLRISQLDIETAYLNGKMDTEVFMEQPELLGEMLRRIASADANPEFSSWAHEMLKEMSGTAKVCKLNRALRLAPGRPSVAC